MLNDGQRRRNQLINLAIGIAVIAVLVSLILSDVRTKVRQRHTQVSLINLRNIVLAVNNHAASNNGQLPIDTIGAASLSWRMRILQYLVKSDLHRAYHRNFAWDANQNQEFTQTYLKVFDAPAGGRDEKTARGFAISDYGMISGPGTVHPDDHIVTLDEISEGDGLGQTLLLGECVGLRLAWAEPRDPRVDREIIGIETLTSTGQTSNKLLSSYTQGGAPVAFADGSARILNAKLDPRVLQALCTVDGDEGINQSDYLE